MQDSNLRTRIAGPALRWVAFNHSANKGATNIWRCLVTMIKTASTVLSVSKKNMQRSHENSNSVVIKQARGGGTRTMNAQH